ncbi:MAG: TRAP transporter small permease subunit [Alphaproteobacteria bacterium]
MAALLRLSGLIDGLNERIGKLCYWLILAAVLVSSGNAIVRYSFDRSSNGWLELQWYMFSAVFLLCAGYTLLRNEHIRIDILITRYPKRVQVWVDIIGGLLCLLPMSLMIMVLSWPIFLDSFGRNEMSPNAGGLIQWPFKLIVPVGFFLLALQGVSEIIKRIAYLMGLAPDPTEKTHAHGAESGQEPGEPAGA